MDAAKEVPEGLRIIQTRLDQARRGHCTDAPFPLSMEDAELWHRAQASAYQFVLDTLTDHPETAHQAVELPDADEAPWFAPGS